MAATQKSLYNLLGVELRDGQPFGSISPAILRDAVASLASMAVQPPIAGMVQTFDYVPARDGLALLTGGPTDAGYAANAAANPDRIWQPRHSVTDGSAPDPKGSSLTSLGNYQWNVDPEYPWSNSFTPFAIDASGNLRIRSQTTASAGFTAGEIPTNPFTSSTYSYVSGALTSKFRFSQIGGYIEFIAQVPTGYSCWPALWMYPITDKGPAEIDVLEGVGGYFPNTSYSANLHRLSGTTPTTVNGGQDLGGGFHKYAVNWTDSVVEMYYDDVKVSSTSVATDPDLLQALYLIVEMQIGSNTALWVPPPNGTTPSPADLLIKSIRAWQYPGPTTLNLSTQSYLDSQTVGSTVAAISASNFGGNAAYTFTKVADPDSMFTLSGSNLNLAQVVPATTAASHSVTLRVADGVGKTRQRVFSVGVITGTPIQANYITAADLRSAPWSRTNTTAPASNVVMETATNTNHQAAVTNIARTAGIKTFNAWVEVTPAYGRTEIELQIFDSSFGSQAQGYFNLATNTVDYSAVVGSFTSGSSFITPLPSGRIRCGLKFTTDASTTGFNFIVSVALALNQTTYLGDVAKGIQIDNPWLYNIGAGAGGS